MKAILQGMKMEDSDSTDRSAHLIRQTALDLDNENRVIIAWAQPWR